MKLILLLAAMLLVLLPLSAGAETPASGELTVDQLKNATYGGIYDEPVTLGDGKYEGEPFDEGGVAHPSVWLVENTALHIDLDGDGLGDATVWLVENSGGSGSFYYLAAQLNAKGQPQDAGTVLLGDRTQLLRQTSRGGEIVVDIVTQGPDDGLCCPSLKVRKTFGLQDGHLVEIGSEELGPVSLDDLMETDWVLDRLNFDRPALPDVTVTALFADGEVRGTAGCNSYGATLSSEGLKRMTVGPVMSTMKACPDQVMDQEREYLGALEKVVEWSMPPGQLVLTYVGEDDLQGSLFFDPAPVAELEPSASIRIASATEPDEAIESVLYSYLGKDYYTAAAFPNEEDQVRYYYNRIDLNGDGTDEVIALLVGRLSCGTGGCTMLVLRGDGSGAYSVVTEMTLVNAPVLVSEKQSNGWNDLILFVSGGGVKSGYRVLPFDGQSYPANPSLAEPLDEPVKARAYLANELSPAEGILLQPLE